MNQKRINIEYEIILRLLLQPAHGRIIAHDIGVPLTTVQRTLQKMRDANILEMTTEGKNKIYSLKKNIVAQKYIYNAENYKLINLVEKHPFLGIVLAKLQKAAPSMLIILFGSYAKELERKQSDIDIFVETNDVQQKKKLESIHSKFSIKMGTFNTDSALVKEINKHHVIVQGVEEYYEKIGFFT